MKSEQAVNRAKQIIHDAYYLTLATSFNNETWIAPLWFANDDNYSCYFVSEYNSVHAVHIKHNPHVAFSIYNSQEKPEDVNGLQISGVAEEVKLLEIPYALKTMFAKSGADLFKARFKDWNNPESYTHLSKFRIYKLTPKQFWILDADVVETDKRIEVKLI